MYGQREGAPGVPSDLLASEGYEKGNPGSPNLHRPRGLVGASASSHLGFRPKPCVENPCWEEKGRHPDVALLSELSSGSPEPLQITSLKASIFPQAQTYPVSSKVKGDHSLVNRGEGKRQFHHLLIGVDTGEMHLQLKPSGDDTPACFLL